MSNQDNQAMDYDSIMRELANCLSGDKVLDEANYNKFRLLFKKDFVKAAETLSDFAMVIDRLKKSNTLNSNDEQALNKTWSVFAWHVDYIYPEFKADLLKDD